MNNKIKSNHKKLALSATITIVILVFITGTFAWKDYRQHKSNELKTQKIAHDVILVEDFEANDNWSTSEQQGFQKKEIFVKNGQENDKELDDAYIRVQFKEYMDLTEFIEEYSQHRYMIDAKGDYITERVSDSPIDEVLDKLQAKVDNAKINYKVKKEYLEQNKGYFDKHKNWYIISKENDPNGQYGKHLMTKYESSENVTQITDGVSRQKPSTEEEHHQSDHGECLYTPIQWSNKKDQSQNTNHLSELMIRKGFKEGKGAKKYVSLHFNADENAPSVISYQEWLDRYNQMPINKWIVDSSGEHTEKGYIYWGQALKSGQKTEDIFNSLQLIRQPEGESYYVLHVDMQAYSLDDMPDDIPEKLKEMYFRNGDETFQIKAAQSIRNPDKRDDFHLEIIHKDKGVISPREAEISLESVTVAKSNKRLPRGEKSFEYDSERHKAKIHPLINDDVTVRFKVIWKNQVYYVQETFDARYHHGDFIQIGKEIYNNDLKYFKVQFIADQDNPIVEVINDDFKETRKEHVLKGIGKNDIMISFEENLRTKDWEIIKNNQIKEGGQTKTLETIIDVDESKKQGDIGFGYLSILMVKKGEEKLFPERGFKDMALRYVLDQYYDSFIDKNGLNLEKYIKTYYKPLEIADFPDTGYSDRLIIEDYTRTSPESIDKEYTEGKLFTYGISDYNNFFYPDKIHTGLVPTLKTEYFSIFTSPRIDKDMFLLKQFAGGIQGMTIRSHAGVYGSMFINLNK